MYSSHAYQTPAGEGEFYTYDRMGNITQLMRDHRKSHVNALYATYSGNQLLSVYDGGLPNTDYDYQTYPNLSDAEQEYYYDAEGNQTVNLDKDIVATRYNLLNLPDTIQFGNGNRIINYYLSGGERVRTVSRTYTTPLSVPLDAVTNSTDPYIEHTETRTGSWICQDGSPDRLLCSGGYLKVSKKSGSVGLDFHPFSYICDYLGSVRLVCDGKTGEVLQSLEYLPSGLIFRSSNYDFQPNKYTGKELLSMHGLNQYDSNARMQEFQFPIFTTRDPLCEDYYDISPYAYCANNPMRYVDPTGNYVESAWDIASFAMGVKSFVSNVKSGNALGAVVDGVGIVLDAAAVALPVVPGGAGAAIKGVRAIDKAVDVAKTADKTVDVIKVVDKVEDVNNGVQKARFIGDTDGKLIDTMATSKGSYIHPNGTRTDVLQNKPHTRKLGGGKSENHGTTHTHEKYKNILPNGNIKEGIDGNKTHVPTYNEVKQIENNIAKKIK